MALVIALALMTGLQSELRDRILGSTAHVYVFKIGGLRATSTARWRKLTSVPGVVGAAPAILGQGADDRRGRRAAFVTLKGIDPALEPQVTDIGDGDAQRHARRARRIGRRRTRDGHRARRGPGADAAA